MTDLPWFPFYVDDWLRSETVGAMSLAARGLYIECLRHAWAEGSIPADPEALARALRLRVAEVRRLWPQVAPKWEAAAPGRLTNPRQEAERADARRVQQRLSSAGQAGAARRWGRPAPTPTADSQATAVALAVPSPCHSEASAVGMACDAQYRTEQDRERDARARRGSRLPPGFGLTDERRAYAGSKGLPATVVDREFEKFTAHFTAATGRYGVRLDWDATWRKWVLGVDPPRGGWPRDNGAAPVGDTVDVPGRGPVPWDQARREGLV